MPNYNVWCVVFTALAAVTNGQLDTDTVEPDLEPWAGHWFPHPPVTKPEASNTVDTENLHDREHGIRMGITSHACDDAKTNLTLDWDFSPFDYTCYSPTSSKFYPDWRIKPILECENIPKHYVAHHECMNKSIVYDTPIPTFGTHRPLWPRYGEYKFVPRQRWLHNLEHGGVVMLYHPCANSVEVNRLRHLVTNCLRRHVITPIPFLDPERPLGLLTWGCRLTMSTVQPSIITNFIRQHALRGPEKYSKEGQYDLGLRVPAKIVSDFEDSKLCPRR